MVVKEQSDTILTHVDHKTIKEHMAVLRRVSASRAEHGQRTSLRVPVGSHAKPPSPAKTPRPDCPRCPDRAPLKGQKSCMKTRAGNAARDAELDDSGRKATAGRGFACW